MHALSAVAQAKRAKDFMQADILRDQLRAKGCDPEKIWSTFCVGCQRLHVLPH